MAGIGGVAPAARTPGATAGAGGPDPVADVVVRLRRELRRSVRSGQASDAPSVAQVEVLQQLADAPGTRAGELGERLRLAPTTVSTLIGQLLEAAAIERRPDPADRRAWRLHLTPEGRRQLARWQRSHEQVLRDALARLRPADRAAIDRAVPALDRLIGQLHDHAGSGT